MSLHAVSRPIPVDRTGVVVSLTAAEIGLVAFPDYWNALVFSFLVLFAAALNEVLEFRSYPLVRLREPFGLPTSIHTVSVFFTFYHGFQPGIIERTGVWRLFFGISAITSRGLALPLGFNWMQILFGMKTQFATSIWTTTPGTKSGVVTAEDVGLALQLIFLVVGIVLIEFYLKKQSKLVTDT